MSELLVNQSKLDEIYNFIMNNNGIPKKTYTTKEVAYMLNLQSTDKVDLLRKKGVLKGIKKGNGFIFADYVIAGFLHDYEGLDISNEEKIVASYNIVKNRKRFK